MERNARIVREGMGGFLNPPTHPEHDYSIRYNGGAMSLSGAADADYLDQETRDKAGALLADWQPLPIDHPEVKQWVSQVLGYFKGCYRGDGPDPECWNVSKMRTGNPEGFVDEHAGVNHIRRFYPEFVPTETDFDGARWGDANIKPAQRPRPEPVDDETSPLARFIERDGLSMTWTEASSNPNMDDGKNPMFHYSCTIHRRDGERLKVSFSKGKGHVVKGKEYGGSYRTKDQPIPPTLEEVLDCLASDAAGFESSPLFEDWASEYGYDVDSRQAEKTFRAVQEQAARLKKLLGSGLYQELLYEVERL